MALKLLPLENWTNVMLHTSDIKLYTLFLYYTVTPCDKCLYSISMSTPTGSGVGYFIFGAVNARNKAKFTSLDSTLYNKYNPSTGNAGDDTSITTSNIR